MNRQKRDKLIHRLFDLGLIAKAIDGVLEAAGGILLFLVDPRQINHVVRILTQGELSEDPNDFIARHLVHAAHHLSSGTKTFAAIFLLAHGIIKMSLVWALMRRQLWAYPTAITAFLLFLGYQIFRYTHTHSIWLLVLSVLDLFVIVFTWLEYRRMQKS